MSIDKELGDLSPAEWKRLHSLVNRFEEQRQADPQVDLADFLPPPDDSIRFLALQELIKVVLEDWQSGSKIFVEPFVREYPELSSGNKALPKLLAEEYWNRRKSGDKPSIQSYRKRFPDHFAELKRCLDARMDGEFAGEGLEDSSVKVTFDGVREPIVGASSEFDLTHITPPPTGGKSTSGTKPDSRVYPKTSANKQSTNDTAQPSSHKTEPPATGSSVPIGDGYRLLTKLGAGQYGDVWKAETRRGKLVALKIMHWPSQHPATKREMQSLEALKNITHAYLIDVHTYDFWGDRLAVPMGLADSSLRDRQKELKTQGFKGMPKEELLHYMRETADVLDFLSSRNLQHRDIKPGNILLLSGHVKLGDLGLAKVLQERLQMDASILGTRPYMAPEVWTGQVHTNSDQYSLAITYIELRRGRCPFKNANINGLLPEHLQDAPPLVPLTEEERKVLLRAGEKDPERRYPTCTEFVTALEEALCPDRPAGYKKLELISNEGTFGTVWRGEALGGRLIAIKTVRLEDEEKCKSELQALEYTKDLDHPNLVTIHAFWNEAEELHIAMSLADCNLREYLRMENPSTPQSGPVKAGTLLPGQAKKAIISSPVTNETAGWAQQKPAKGFPVEKLLKFLMEIAGALDYLHEKDIVHRDVKPENILIKEDRAVLADFGLARMMERQRLFTATMSGTMAYMPPEVWEGKLCHESDQYSLAATYVDLRLGHHLFQATSLRDLMVAHQTKDPDLTPLPDAEQRVLKKALAKAPDKRFASCTDFVDALETAIYPEKKTQPPAPPTVFSWQHAAIFIAAVALLAACAYGLMAILFSGGSFAVSGPDGLKLTAGKKRQIITLEVRRNNWDDPIELNINPLPGVINHKQNATIGSGQNHCKFSVDVQATAKPKVYVLDVTALSDGREERIAVPFTVEWLASIRQLNTQRNAGSFEPSGTAEVREYKDRQFYTQIDCVLPDKKSRIPFMLIYPKNAAKKKWDPFYIMRDMVHNEVFAIFAKANPNEVMKLNGDWTEGAQILVAGKEKSLGIGDGRLPALRVDLFDAFRFARWLGGKLPTKKQWEKAAGKMEPNRGHEAVHKVGWPGWPFGKEFHNEHEDIRESMVRKYATLGIGSGLPLDALAPLHCCYDCVLGIACWPETGRPMRIGSARWDESPYGCRDMSANGFEWTCTERTRDAIDNDLGERNLLDLHTRPTAKIWLCSQSYRSKSPSFFDAIETPTRRPAPLIGKNAALRPGKDAHLIGFRVVILP